MSSKIREVMDRIEAEQRQAFGQLIPDDLTLFELAEQVVRGKVKLSPPKMRMLIELLPFHAPKLTAVAVGTLNNQDFASRLEQALQRSDGAKLVRMIEGRAEPTD